MGTYRAILTEREREILTGEADVSQDYVYQIRTRVRNKIDRLAEDVDILEEYQPDLFAELQDVLDGLARE